MNKYFVHDLLTLWTAHEVQYGKNLEKDCVQVRLCGFEYNTSNSSEGWVVV